MSKHFNNNPSDQKTLLNHFRCSHFILAENNRKVFRFSVFSEGGNIGEKWVKRNNFKGHGHLLLNTKFSAFAKIKDSKKKKIKKLHSFTALALIMSHSFSTYAEFSEKLTFLTPRYAHLRKKWDKVFKRRPSKICGR